MSNGLQPVSYHLVTLYQTDHFVFAFELYYDEITAVFSIVGAFLFFLVATFSKYYMHRDQGYKRFFNTILLFAAGYNFIILSGNFETLFIGWEIKGVCSFLLIAFYRNRYLPVKNAFKAISYYRISDVSLMLAMWMMHHLTHQNISFTELGEAKNMAVTIRSHKYGCIHCLHDHIACCHQIGAVPIHYLVAEGHGRAHFFFRYISMAH